MVLVCTRITRAQVILLPLLRRYVNNYHGMHAIPLPQGALEKRGKETYGPPLGKRLLLWLDDMSMPQRDAYGTQQPLALLRQLLDRKARPLDICFIVVCLACFHALA